MARTRAQKEILVAEYIERLKNSKAVYVLEPKKLTVNMATQIKKDMYDLDSTFNVIKNSLFKRALEESNMEVSEQLSAEQKAVVFSSDQITESAKIIKKFIKENVDILEIKLGYLDGKQITASQIDALAELPSREVMLGQVLGTMKAPITGFVRVLGGNISNFMNVVNAIKEQKA